MKKKKLEVVTFRCTTELKKTLEKQAKKTKKLTLSRYVCNMLQTALTGAQDERSTAV